MLCYCRWLELGGTVYLTCALDTVYLTCALGTVYLTCSPFRCLRDDECDTNRSNRYLCCPTGCNYNVCVRARNRPTELSSYLSKMQWSNNGMGRSDLPLPHPPKHRPLMHLQRTPTWQENAIIWEYERQRQMAPDVQKVPSVQWKGVQEKNNRLKRHKYNVTNILFSKFLISKIEYRLTGVCVCGVAVRWW